MSKNIKISSSAIEDVRAEINALLDKGVFPDGQISFKKSLIKDTNLTTKLEFSEIAWYKMKALVDNFSTEVGWHGICARKDDGFLVKDIVVYPQIVTGVTVETDQAQYETWLFEQPDDVFNNIRFHGHSHVNMGTSPSSTDTNFYNGVIEQCRDDDFYVFFIINKKSDITAKIYDFKRNTLFETKDISIVVINDNLGLESFVKESEGFVKTKPKEVPVCKKFVYKKKEKEEPDAFDTVLSSLSGLSQPDYEEIKADPFGVWNW